MENEEEFISEVAAYMVTTIKNNCFMQDTVIILIPIY